MSTHELREGRDFLADSRVERVRRGEGELPALYRCSLGDQWNAALFPFGGFVSAVAVRAMREELALPEHRPRSMTTLFNSPVKTGEVEVEVKTLRRGRGMSQLQATVRNIGDSEPGHTTLAVFGGARPGFEFTDLAPPDIPAPAGCDVPPALPVDSPMARATFFDQVEVRSWGFKAPGRDDWQAGGPARALRWMRYREAPRRADGTLDPIAYLPLCDTMPPSIGQRLGPRHPSFFAPSCDLTVHWLGETRREWLIVDARTHHAGDGYASASIELWDEDRRLLARATQLVFLRLDEPVLRESVPTGLEP